MQNVLLIDATEGRRSSGGIFSVSDLLPNTTCHLKLLAENEKGMGPEFIWHTTTDKGQLAESYFSCSQEKSILYFKIYVNSSLSGGLAFLGVIFKKSSN